MRLRAAGTPTAQRAATSRRRAAAGNAPAESTPASTFRLAGEAPAITDADCAETVDCGCNHRRRLLGPRGCELRRHGGAKTLLIEKFDKGTGLRGSAIGAVGSRKQQEAGVNIDPQEICNDLVHYSLNNASMDLYQLWAAHSAEAVNWYCDLTDGVDQCKIDLEWSMPAEETRYKCWPTGHGAMLDNGKAGKDEASGEGVTYAQVEANFLAQPNAELRYLTSLECLIKEGDKVVGAYASTDEGATFLRINAAKGVIVATGGSRTTPTCTWRCRPERQGTVRRGALRQLQRPGQGIKACLWAARWTRTPPPWCSTAASCVRPAARRPRYGLRLLPHGHAAL
ncbi:MAG: FAD-binding protein [Coriobacteriaceae bacterium]